MLVAEILMTSIIGEALFAMSMKSSFVRYWSKLGGFVPAVLDPAHESAETFAVVIAAFVVVLTPPLMVMYGLAYLLPVRWFELGRWKRLPDDWFRKNPTVTTRRAVMCIGAGIATMAAWPLFLFLDPIPPLIVVMLLPFAIGAVALFRWLTRRMRIGVVVAFLALVIVAPTLTAELATPALTARGDDDSWGELFFEPRRLYVAHHVTPDGERPIVVLGSTVLGDVVIYDACAHSRRAEVVTREAIASPRQLAECR